MQKFLIGCLAVIAIVVIGGGTAGYFFVIKPAWEFASEVGEFATEYQQLNEQIERTEGFQPPADGQLDPDRFQRFLVAQRDMRSQLQGQLQALDARWDQIQQEIKEDGRQANVIEIVTAYRDLGGLLIDAKRAQVDALNRYQFSLEEYAWTRNQTFRALGEQVAVTAFGEQGSPMPNRAVSDEVLALVSPHREELMEGYVMAWFGL
ncbi:hypothetical protein [Wenzhouxiangella marina]|uniref:Uncharacterized protein n=1 Tax=Wenzhouxiangella marina TaxID=1579979 RepID=A0A0K0Y0C4_9GAMM|nr:hypothetical protein [Wenzhouxiangella marina]AKS43370.1 hypothetical protein WM2015_3018 [Wenzhouxiangella marina]MBB6088514.1 hypothetical protein [Wenzhouxiangella marina]